MSFPTGWRLVVACAPLLVGCTAELGPSRPSFDYVTDCENRPYYDTVSASDHTTIIKGMTPEQREACLRLWGEHHDRGM